MTLHQMNGFYDADPRSGTASSLRRCDLKRAIAIAFEAHAGQIDKNGKPYVLHAIRVMLRLQGETDRIVGVLHDVVEVCPSWSMHRLCAEGFSDDVLDAIRALTSDAGEPYEDFIARCRGNAIARRVKLADLADNMDPSRPAPGALMTRYERARDSLAAAGA